MYHPVLKSMLRIRRLLADLTQEDLAQRVGVTRQTVGAIEKGVFAPSVSLAIRLARSLQCTIEDLFQAMEEETGVKK